MKVTADSYKQTVNPSRTSAAHSLHDEHGVLSHLKKNNNKNKIKKSHFVVLKPSANTSWHNKVHL